MGAEGKERGEEEEVTVNIHCSNNTKFTDDQTLQNYGRIDTPKVIHTPPSLQADHTVHLVRGFTSSSPGS
ncbi:hypothetical protein V6N11_020296 [Hibiscus sabdariffa]|uniref:Uncharacterized protein n=1 Tax=Hibiscus sabdariffa TaxID=183260 RepID=A0ABR2Q8D1_9ROSI